MGEFKQTIDARDWVAYEFKREFGIDIYDKSQD
jgi:hypothetical protein